jgi:hypothetical protein
MRKNLISLTPEKSIVFTCPSYLAQITYPNYQFGYTSHLTSLCSPNWISRPDVTLMGNGELAEMRKEPIMSLFSRQSADTEFEFSQP